jgi:hypothetical protein
VKVVIIHITMPASNPVTTVTLNLPKPATRSRCAAM